MSLCAHRRRPSMTFSSSCRNTVFWKARATALLDCSSICSAPPRLWTHLWNADCKPPYVKARLPRMAGGMSRCSASSGKGRSSGPPAQKASRPAPKPIGAGLMPSAWATLSIARPTAESCVVARVLKVVEEVARSRRVCPPEMSRVRNGNCGSSDNGVVKRGVKACAC